MLPPALQILQPDARQPRRSAGVEVSLGLLLAAAVMPGFGAVVGSTDTGADFAGRSGMVSAATTLDNALTAERTTGQDNLDLLLRTPRPEPGTGDLLGMSPRVGFAGAAAKAPAPNVAEAGARLGTEASLPLLQSLRQQPQRDWAQLAGGVDGAGSGDGSRMAPDGSAMAVPTSDLHALQAPLLQVVQLVRENRAWLLGGLVLLLLLGAAVKAFSRRI